MNTDTDGRYNAAHTPGPWNRNIKPAHKYPTVFAGRNTHVAKIVSDGIGVSECEANINLIAAAPELLQALIHTKTLLSACLLIITHDESRQLAREAVDRARAAIAKATGAQHD